MGRRTFKPTPRVLGALASPLRQDILVVLENSAPTSVAELARRIGRRPDALYHHLRLLKRAGLVRRSGGDSTGGRPGGLWTVTAHPIQVSARGAASPTVQLAGQVVGAMARAGARDFQRAYRRHLAGHGPKPGANRWCVWLDARELAAMERALKQVVQRFRALEPRPSRTPFIVTWLLSSVTGGAPAPAARRRRAARKPAPRG